MAEVGFGTADDVTGANSGEEVVVNEPKIEMDGDRMTVTVTAEQAEAVRKALAQKPEEKKEEKPEWLGEFKTPEDMAKAYKELRTKMSQGKPEEKPAEKPEDQSGTPKSVDLGPYVEEWNVNKALSDESYAELEKAGYPREVVDNYIAGRVATAAKDTATIYEAAGGEEAYAALLEWGKVNLPKESQVAYDQLLNAGNYAAAALALRGFVQQYEAAEGSSPRAALNAAQQGGAGTAQGFSSKSDMIAAINDRRYKNGDRAYVEEVQRRILASRF